MHLLPRLAAFRGRWQNDRLQGALAEAIEQLRTAPYTPCIGLKASRYRLKEV